MAIQWKIEDLDPSKLFEVNYSRDPDIGGRFSLPIPNWLNASGEPLEAIQKHIITKKQAEQDFELGIYKDDEGKWRFSFINYKDNGCLQGVKIDGTGSVMFGAPTLGQTQKLFTLISEVVPELGQMSPAQLIEILERSHTEIVITDRYNDSDGNIKKEMDLVDDNGSGYHRYGLYVYKPEIISSCIYLSGSGVFLDGPTETPQGFDNGGFIFFKNKRIDQATQIIKSAVEYDHNKEIDPDDKKAQEDHKKTAPKGKAKYVEKGVLLTSRMRAETGTPIKINELKPQDRPVVQMVKIDRITGFPEYLPEDRAIEREWERVVSDTFETYGYTGIQTPSVERIDVLEKQGSTSHQMYGLRRLSEDSIEDTNEGKATKEEEAKLGLHYDLTVPFARYVAMNFGQLTFPFKRYQIQKVWRGESAQKGRYREFTQADIDVVNPHSLSMDFDAEMPVTMWHVIDRLNIGPVTIGINNRKILNGLYKGIGVDPITTVNVIRIMDDFDKEGEDGVRKKIGILENASKETASPISFTPDQISFFIAIAMIKGNAASFRNQVDNLGVKNDELRLGLDELDFVLDRTRELPDGAAVPDLSIARAFDYYTGTIYEGRLQEYPEFGAIASGGRYDDLAKRFTKTRLPGVGMSLGLSRLFGRMHEQGLLPKGNASPTDLLITVSDQEQVGKARTIADDLRHKGISVEVYHNPNQRIGRQMEYAVGKDGKSGKQIPYVMFFMDDGTVQVKNTRTQVQEPANMSVWQPSKLRRT